MRVPVTWLRDYVSFDLSPQALAEQLTLRGMEVSAIEVTGADWSDVVVGRLITVERHPNADKLWLTTVDVGDPTGPLQVVCGADNVAPGQLVPVARVGAVLPGERRIERSKIRGVESQGMLCSSAELGLGDDAEGIHILGSGEELPIGADLRGILGDVVLDVDVKPNRGDALSMVGLAREIAAITGSPLRLPEIHLREDASLAVDERVSVVIEDAEGCPRFSARVFVEISNGASPGWMQQRLLAAGIRPISAVVDVTNYVMHELGQPMHAYDAAAIPGGRIVVRRARDGEELETIDHQTRTLDARMLVIADAERPIGLAGIMGGASTEVGAETDLVILESAIFHGPTIRNAARRLGLRSEASMRHEKGIGHHLPRLALDRAAGLMAELTGARVATGIADNDPQDRPPRIVSVSVARTDRLLGIPLTADAVGELLAPLEFAVETDGSDEVRVSVPSHRLDVVAPEDVAEEIARSYGYGRIEGRLPVAVLPPFRGDPSEARHQTRRILAGVGLDEVVTHALIGPADLARCRMDEDDPTLVRVANPLAEQHSIMRPSLVPSLLAALAENVRQRRSDAWLFEVGKTYTMGLGGDPDVESAGTGRHEAWAVGIAMIGPRRPRSPGDDAGDAEVADLKAIVEGLHLALGAPMAVYRPQTEDAPPHLHPGRTAELVEDAGRGYGLLGEIHPAIAEAWDLPGRPLVAVLSLSALLKLAPGHVRATSVPATQPIDRDLAVILDESTGVGDLLRIVRSSAGATLASARLFDEYRGPQIGTGRVSYAIALRFQPESADDERGVERSLDRVRGALKHHLRAEIR